MGISILTVKNQGLIHLTISSTALAIYVGVILQYMLRDFLLQLRFLLLSVNWSYLFVSYITVFTAIYSILARAGVAESIRVSRILLYVILVLLSLMFYFMGYVNEYYLPQYHGLSFALLMFAIINLIFNLKGVLEAATILVILLCTIPVPSSISILSPSIYASLANTTSKQVLLAGTGLTMAGSTLSTAPLIIATLRNDGRRRRSIAYSTLLLLVAVVIGFTGDIIRISLISQNLEQSITSKLLSSTAIYAFVSILPALLYYRKNLFSPPNIEETRARWTGFISMLSIVFILLITLTGIAYALSYASPSVREPGITISNYEDLMSKPASIILGKLGLEVYNEYSYRYNDGSEDMLLSEYSLKTNTTEYIGVLDLTRSPCKLYSVNTFLEYKGYRVKLKWVSQDNTMITYYIAENSSSEVIVAESLLKLTVPGNNSRENYYARITLIANNVGDLVNLFNNTLTNASNGKSLLRDFNVLKALAALTYIFILLSFIYLSIEPLRRILKHRGEQSGEFK